MNICMVVLVAPLLESGNSRICYLPKGKWIDYQTKKVYEGGYQTITIPAKEQVTDGGEAIPCIILVRDGSLIPTVPVAQSTAEIDWSKLTWNPFKVDAQQCIGLEFKPGDTSVKIVKQ